MEYINVMCVVYNDGTDTKRAMYTYDSSDTAIAGAHKYMGQFMAQSNVSSVMCMAINSIGGIYANYHWTAPVVYEDQSTTE